MDLRSHAENFPTKHFSDKKTNPKDDLKLKKNSSLFFIAIIFKIGLVSHLENIVKNSSSIMA